MSTSEIFVQDSFASELANVKSVANSIATGSQTLDNEDATATTMEFAARYKRVQRLLVAYKELLTSDVEELEKFYQDMKNLDQSLSS